MAYDFDKKKEKQEKNTKKGAEERFTSGPQLPNSLIMRIMEDPQAEQEADQLSLGVRSRTPDMLMREMGSRLGADFSSVRFHDDPDSVGKSRAMGARAWAQGRDVYFGRGGFEPSVAAHELVHTVQQGAVKGNVSRSMPTGAVQLLPDDEDDKIKIKKDEDEDDQVPDMPGNDATEIQALESDLLFYFRNPDSAGIASEFTSRMKSLLKSKFGRRINYNANAGVRFFVRACYRDYALREILQEVIAAPVGTKAEKKSRKRDYKGLIKTLSSRLTPADAEELATETGMFTGVPQYERVKTPKLKRAYETDAGTDGLVTFNPNHIPELAKVQDAIDHARTPEQAYSIFAAYAGNNSSFKDRYKNVKLNMNLFRAKLKQMARVITDYPELKYHIGNMNVIDPKSNTLMSTDGTRGGERPAEFQYNKRVDEDSIWADLERDIRDEQNKTNPFHISPGQYHGTHELGHAMASTLIESNGQLEKWFRTENFSQRKQRRERGEQMPDYKVDAGMGMSKQIEEERKGLRESNILENVLAKNKDQMKKLYNPQIFSFGDETDSHLKGMISTRSFHKSGMTSEYGSQNASEMFAEAVADVYSHGTGAREMSKELVKEYEIQHKKKVRDQFKENRKSWWQRLFGL